MTGKPASSRVLLLAVCGLAVLIVAGLIQWNRRGARPNIVLVTLDTTRADHLGAYGYDQGLTSAFDEFASRGVIFDEAYTPAPITLPSHVTILTGLYPPEHGLRVNGTGKLPDSVPYLPEILSKQGYETGAFVAASVVLGAQFGLDRGFDTYNDEPGKPGPYRDTRCDGREVVDRALSWMKQRTDEPFFCWIHLYDAHAPYMPRPDIYEDRFADNPYDAGIAWELQQFERVTDYLDEQNLSSNTLVVVAGDHGEGLDEHGESEHGHLNYNTTLHVPLAFAGLPSFQSGTRVNSAVSLTDLTPTLLDVLDLPQPAHTSGRSLLPALQGQKIESQSCYAEAQMPYTMSRWCPLETIVSDNWKYIQSTRPELYNLRDDPAEKNNLIDTAVDESQRLQDLLSTVRGSFQRTVAEKVELSEQDLADLRSLGYVSGGTTTQTTHDADPDTDSETDEQLVDVKDMVPFIARFEKAKHVAADGGLDEAIAMLQEVAWATDKFPMSDLMLGDLLTQTGRNEEALSIYHSVLARRPDYVRAHVNLGRNLVGQQRFEEAVPHFREFIKANPNDASGPFELGQVLARLKRLDEAVLEFRACLRLAPDFAAAYFSLGSVLLQLGRPGEAVTAFEGALKHNPRNIAAYENLMMVLARAGQLGKAIQYGQKAVAISPRSFNIRFNLGLMLVNSRQFAAGIQQLQEAQALRPGDPRPAQQIQQAQAAMRAGQQFPRTGN